MSTIHDNLVAQYRLAGDAGDSAGGGLNGTPENVTWVAGMGSQVGVFNGTNARVSTAAFVGSLSAFTCSFWINATIPGADTYKRIIHNSADANNHFQFTGQVNDFEMGFGVTVGGVLTATRAITLFQSSRWRHVAGVWSGSSVSLFVDGVQESAAYAGTPGGSAAAGLSIGARNDLLAATFTNCLLSNVRIYNAALSAADVRRDYHGLLPARRYA